MNVIRTTALTAAAVAALTGPLTMSGASQAATTPGGALVSARAALRTWDCAPIADQKFWCQNDTTGAGFSVNLRPKASLPKWQEDPEMSQQIAVIRKTYFLTVQANDLLSQADFDKIKQTIARH